ncbi:isopentenyl phosphate kinase-like [Curcuma longa]|uniref:isopentenyl phosphate kinase-like n=1 Tax=Curcuma longa TaxID=136217 RepID=UPI003D9E1F79
MGDEEKKIATAPFPSDQIQRGCKAPLRCIVKLGGAAITCKNELESINVETLKSVCAQLREAMTASTNSSPGSVPSMDWSTRMGYTAVSLAEDFKDGRALDLVSNFIVVHGAGSFGHFQASTSGVHRGGLHLPLVKAGFVATRISVTSLNLEIVRALARGMPFFLNAELHVLCNHVIKIGPVAFLYSRFPSVFPHSRDAAALPSFSDEIEHEGSSDAGARNQGGPLVTGSVVGGWFLAGRGLESVRGGG